MVYIQRVLEPAVLEYLTWFPVAGIAGPRQSGKSTILQHLLSDRYEYVTFDDHRTLELFSANPEKFMRLDGDRVIFDKVQKAPQIFNYIKLAVDRDRRKYGKFVLTGSSQFAVMRGVSETLAGRIGLLSLLPFQHSEVPNGLREESIFRGSYPELVTRKYHGAEDWYASYVDTYLSRDVRSVSNIGDLHDFRRCMQLLAVRTAQILNMSDLARDIGVTVSTMKKWVSVLEASYVLFLLPPYYKNLGKRIVKSPKVYFHDTGLVSFFVGIDSKKEYEKGPMHGPLFENYIVSEVLKRELHRTTKSALHYYRTNHGVEVDLIVDRKSSRDLIEVKTTETFRPEMFRSIEQVLGKKDGGYLLYPGKSAKYSDASKVLNYHGFLSEYS
jgi:hypothetical protein